MMYDPIDRDFIHSTVALSDNGDEASSRGVRRVIKLWLRTLAKTGQVESDSRGRSTAKVTPYQVLQRTSCNTCGPSFDIHNSSKLS